MLVLYCNWKASHNLRCKLNWSIPINSITTWLPTLCLYFICSGWTRHLVGHHGIVRAFLYCVTTCLALYCKVHHNKCNFNPIKKFISLKIISFKWVLFIYPIKCNHGKGSLQKHTQIFLWWNKGIFFLWNN